MREDIHQEEGVSRNFKTSFSINRMLQANSLIKGRASIRKFTKRTIPADILEDILDCGRWAPSGLNNQPWFFISITNQDILQQLAMYTSSGEVIRQSAASIAIFFDTPKGYHRIKDILSLGACIENILLGIHAHGLGACWLGEILKMKDKVNEVLKMPRDRFELMAVIALGYPGEEITNREREPLSVMWRKEFYSQ